MFKRKHLIIFIAGITALSLAGCGRKQVKTADRQSTENRQKAVFMFQETEYDFGVVKQSGGIVKHDFNFTYNGEDPIKVTGTPASCACTSGKISKTEFKKGDTGILTVEFDPNLHEEPEGKFYKTVSILTEPKPEIIPEVKIWVSIDLDLGVEAYKLKSHDKEDEHHDEAIEYNGQKIHLIEPEELKEDLKNKDFFLLDVHIPEQTHIAETDAVIDYRKIKENTDKLPTDKSTKIVVYCRSGNMSRSAAQDLIDMGYKNVYDLEGGIKAFNAL